MAHTHVHTHIFKGVAKKGVAKISFFCLLAWPTVKGFVIWHLLYACQMIYYIHVETTFPAHCWRARHVAPAVFIEMISYNIYTYIYVFTYIYIYIHIYLTYTHTYTHTHGREVCVCGCRGCGGGEMKEEV